MSSPRKVPLDTPNPVHIIELVTGYWASMMLITANRLGVFTQLDAGPQTADELAARCGVNVRTLEMLLNACVAHALIGKEEGRYRNSATTAAFLVEGKPTYLGHALRYAEDLYPVWGKLEESVRSNGPAFPPDTILGMDREKTRNFVLAMHNRAIGVGTAVTAELDLTGRKRLLDIGAGPGTYSILLVRKTPGLRSTVLDLPPVAEIAREIIGKAGCGEKIDVMAGDYLKVPFPDGNDVVLMSGMMHRETEDDCKKLLDKAFASLVPGGLVVVTDVMYDDEDKTSPPLSALFALNMLLTSRTGAAHAQTTFARWIAEAGFSEIRSVRLNPPMAHVALLTGDKPLSAGSQGVAGLKPE